MASSSALPVQPPLAGTEPEPAAGGDAPAPIGTSRRSVAGATGGEGSVRPTPRRSCASNTSPSNRAFFTDLQSQTFSQPPPDKVECCSFPGIDDCAELPPGSKPAPEIMREAARLVNFATRNHEVHFARCWGSKPCEELLVAFVWHVICEHFKPDPEAQDALFSKLATSYAALFGMTLVTTEAKDAASWYLPEALAHSACLALLSAFPKSKGQFDAGLRRTLFRTFVHWTSGFAGQRSLDGDAAVAARAERNTANANHGLHHGHHHGGGGAGGNGGGGAGGAPAPGVPRLKLSKLLDERDRMESVEGREHGGRLGAAAPPAVSESFLAHQRGAGATRMPWAGSLGDSRHMQPLRWPFDVLIFGSVFVLFGFACSLARAGGSV